MCVYVCVFVSEDLEFSERLQQVFVSLQTCLQCCVRRDLFVCWWRLLARGMNPSSHHSYTHVSPLLVSLVPRLPTFVDCVKEKGKPGRIYHVSDVRVDR